jgi:hypothetical protein
MTTTPPDSLLAGLKQRRTQVVDEQRLTLPVPRWHDPEIVVTYRPLTHDEAVDIGKRTEKIKNTAVRQMAGAQDQLSTACVAVEAVVDGQRYSLRPGDPHGEPTRFDTDLAENLGVEEQTARAVVSALFVTDADLLSHNKRLIEWSGYAEAQADEEFSGEA